jgi:hypothetical protein
VPWDELTDEVKSWDLEAVKAIPGMLAELGYEIYDP